MKPRAGYGGEGVVVGPHAEAGDLRETARAVAERPEDYVAQEMVMLSTHPTVVDDRLEPRHVDLRPFAFGGEDGEVAPAGSPAWRSTAARSSSTARRPAAPRTRG